MRASLILTLHFQTMTASRQKFFFLGGGGAVEASLSTILRLFDPQNIVQFKGFENIF